MGLGCLSLTTPRRYYEKLQWNGIYMYIHYLLCVHGESRGPERCWVLYIALPLGVIQVALTPLNPYLRGLVLRIDTQACLIVLLPRD
jgi:hypothetical protein